MHCAAATSEDTTYWRLCLLDTYHQDNLRHHQTEDQVLVDCVAITLQAPDNRHTFSNLFHTYSTRTKIKTQKVLLKWVQTLLFEDSCSVFAQYFMK